MGVGVDKARHERRAAAIDNSLALAPQRLPAFGNFMDAIALDFDFGRVKLLARSVKELGRWKK